MVAGNPPGELIVQYGPFVVTRMDDIKQAITDYNKGALARKKATLAS